MKEQHIRQVEGIEFKVVYSKRRSLGISVLPDSTVIVRVPSRTSDKTINRIVSEKASWIIRHRDNYRNRISSKPSRKYLNGEYHLFRGNESLLRIEKSKKPYIKFSDRTIELGLENNEDPKAIKKLVYKGYKNEATALFPEMLKNILEKFENQMFRPTGLIIRTMKRRWGSCSNKGIITLSTEMVKLPDLFTEYVIVHELCHLKHHNHGSDYYKLLSKLFPDWKTVRKEMRNQLIN